MKDNLYFSIMDVYQEILHSISKQLFLGTTVENLIKHLRKLMTSVQKQSLGGVP